jgi:phage terminase large subunit GpA-like protein
MIDEQLARAFLGALGPPPKIAPSIFAESQIILPASANAIPGPLRLAPYQRELVDAIADDETEIIVLMLSSQTGKSTVVDAVMSYCIGSEPGPMLHVSPTGSRSADFVRDRFDPLIAASPALRALVGSGQDTRKGNTGGSDSLSSKSFPGGQLNFASSFKPDELAARPIRFLFLDEIDRFAVTAGVEGDPIALAIKRTKTFEGKGRKIIIVSTPTSRMGSRINQWFIHTEKTRRAMVEGGRWEATATGVPGIRSYHLNELASKFSTLASVAQQFEVAKTPEQKQAFYNTTLAQVYDAGTEVELSSSELQQQASALAPPYAADIAFVTCGVDLQGDRLEVTSLAHHADGSHSVLNHHKLMGDPSGNAVWQELDRVLGAAFTLADGRALPIAATAIDSGFSTERVLAFVAAQRAKSRRIVPVRGKSGFERDPVSWGRKIRGQTQRVIVGVDVIKRDVQRRLARHDVDLPPIRLPDHLPPEYFQGLASEELRARSVKGFTVYEYHRTFKQNEPLDCLVYATAIGKLINPQTVNKLPAQPSQSFAELAKKLNARH